MQNPFRTKHLHIELSKLCQNFYVTHVCKIIQSSCVDPCLMTQYCSTVLSVFVMKCMENVIYGVVHHDKGNLGDVRRMKMSLPKCVSCYSLYQTEAVGQCCWCKGDC